MKRTLASLALLLTVACASAPMQSSSSSAPGAPAPAMKVNDAPNLVLLSDPNQVRNVDWALLPKALHVRGTMTSQGFKPVGTVQGKGPLCTDGKDWLSLTDLTAHKAGDGKTPTAPYLTGCISGTQFQPSSRDIVLQ